MISDAIVITDKSKIYIYIVKITFHKKLYIKNYVVFLLNITNSLLEFFTLIYILKFLISLITR